jgi:hypothetical protein
MTATATATLELENILELRAQWAREGEINRNGVGGYTTLGRLIELRHEVAKDANSPNIEMAKKMGVVMDWRHFHNGPLLGLSRDKQLLFIGKVNPLPTLTDPDWKLTQMVDMPYGRIPAASLSAKELQERGIRLEIAPQLKQNFTSHMSGTFGDFVVCRPLTQASVKMDGIPGFLLIKFANDVYTGESAAFFLNLMTGEGHIYGGQFVMQQFT